MAKTISYPHKLFKLKSSHISTVTQEAVSGVGGQLEQVEKPVVPTSTFELGSQCEERLEQAQSSFAFDTLPPQQPAVERAAATPNATAPGPYGRPFLRPTMRQCCCVLSRRRAVELATAALHQRLSLAHG